MNKHLKNLELVVSNIYIAILVVMTSISGIVVSLILGSYGFSLLMNVLGLILYGPTLYSYYIKKSIDEFGRDLEQK